MKEVKHNITNSTFKNDILMQKIIIVSVDLLNINKAHKEYHESINLKDKEFHKYISYYKDLLIELFNIICNYDGVITSYYSDSLIAIFGLQSRGYADIINAINCIYKIKDIIYNYNTLYKIKKIDFKTIVGIGIDYQNTLITKLTNQTHSKQYIPINKYMIFGNIIKTTKELSKHALNKIENDNFKEVLITKEVMNNIKGDCIVKKHEDIILSTNESIETYTII